MKIRPGFERLNDSDSNLLTQALALAAEQYDGYARDCFTQRDAYDAMTPEAKAKIDASAVLVHPGALGQLAEQFQRQASRTREIIDFLQGDDDESEDYTFEVGRYVSQA